MLSIAEGIDERDLTVIMRIAQKSLDWQMDDLAEELGIEIDTLELFKTCLDKRLKPIYG